MTPAPNKQVKKKKKNSQLIINLIFWILRGEFILFYLLAQACIITCNEQTELHYAIDTVGIVPTQKDGQKTIGKSISLVPFGSFIGNRYQLN